MTDPHVYVVIPVHNRRAHTMACLASLEGQTYAKLTVIVVDDGSTDGTAKAIASRFTHVVVLRGDGNLWWAGATNVGVEWVLARCHPNDFVLTLNNDTTVGPEYVERLVHFANQWRPALVGSVCVDARRPEFIVDGGPMMSWWRAKLRFLNARRPLAGCLAEGTTHVEPTCLPGRGTLIPVSCFGDGLFRSDKLPHYGADYEFSIRAARAGYRLLMSYENPVVGDMTTTGLSPSRGRVPWSQFISTFFTIRSPAALRYRYRYAWLCVPRRCLPVFAILDTIRVIGGAVRDQVLQPWLPPRHG